MLLKISYMKIKNTLIIIVFIFFVSNSLFAQQTKQQKLQRVWMLVEFQKFAKQDFVNLNAQLDLTNFNQPTAKMGCNNISFAMKISKKTIKFSKISRTMMYCENQMIVEDAFAKALPEFNRYYIVGHQLILKNKKGEKMIFIAQDWD